MTEYRVVYLRRVIAYDVQQGILNELANDGWRLVAVDGGWAYLERAKP